MNTDSKRTYHGRSTVSRHFTLASSGRGGLVHRQVTSDGPLGSTNRLRRLIELRRHVQIMNRRLAPILRIEADQGVDLEVCKVEVDVDRVEADEEVNEGVFLFCGYVGEEGGGYCCAGGERCVDGDVEFECFSVYVADVDTAFVCEEDRVALAGGVDADIVFCVRRVGQERLDDEVVESTGDGLDLPIN